MKEAHCSRKEQDPHLNEHQREYSQERERVGERESFLLLNLTLPEGRYP